MIEQLDRLLRYQAATYLRQTENVRSVLGWARKNPHEFRERVGTFEEAFRRMNETIEFEEFDGRLYKNLSDFKRKIKRWGTAPTLREYVEIDRDTQRDEGNTEFSDRAITALQDINRKIVSSEWGFVTKITDNPSQVASGLLIEGYGRLLDDYYFEAEGVGRSFVLALEEVLITEFEGSALLNDVIGWMREEKHEFSVPVVRRLETGEW